MYIYIQSIQHVYGYVVGLPNTSDPTLPLYDMA